MLYFKYKVGEILNTERIKKQRNKLRFTQKQLAEKVGVSPQVISNWERGYTDPSAEDIARLAEVLECTSDYLLGVTDNINKNNSIRDLDVEKEEEEFQAFINDPELNTFYKELPESDEEAVRRLREIWEIIKKDFQK